MKVTHDLIIIGGGISGLSFSFFLDDPHYSTLLIEQEERAGGCLATHYCHSQDDFFIEVGAHTCYNSYGILIEKLRKTGLINQLQKREKVPFRFFIDGQIKSVLSQMNFRELLLSLPKILTAKKENQSMESYYSKIMGKKNYKNLFGPAFNAVISQEASNFPAKLLFKKRPRQKEVLRSYTFSRGLSSIIDAAIENDNLDVLLGSKVEKIEFNEGDGLYQISTANKNVYKSKKLALAVPANVASKLLRDIHPELSEILAQIKYQGISSQGVVIDKKSTTMPPVAGLIVPKAPVYSVVSRDVVSSNLRGFTFHFKPGQLDHQQKINYITKVLSIKEDDIIDKASKEFFLPSLRIGHETLVKEIDHYLSDKNVFLAGNYFQGMAIEDCLGRTLSEINRLKSINLP